MSIKITFKLVSDELFEWIYDGYSALIDNLEPEQDKHIFVYESFTKEDFEKAYLEYRKFIEFNKALQDVENMIKMWPKKELKDKSNYSLSNCVLEWLEIRELKLNKEIKEIFSLDSFNKEYIEKNKYELRDSVLIYYVIDEDNPTKISMAHKQRHFGVEYWLYSWGFYGTYQGVEFYRYRGVEYCKYQGVEYDVPHRWIFNSQMFPTAIYKGYIYKG